MLLLWPALMVSAQQVVRLGKATYASKAPLSVSRTADHGGDQTQYMQYRKLYIKEQMGRPIPTNDWWTDLINADRGRSGQEVTGHLWAYPQYVQGMKYGVDVHYPKYWIDNGTEMKAQSKLVVSGGDGFTAAQPLAEEWSDCTVGFSLLPHGAADFLSADKGMFVTLEHGVPFTWIETKGISPVLSVQKTGNDGSDNCLKGSTTVKLLTADGTTLTSGACQQFIVAIGATETRRPGGVCIIRLRETHQYRGVVELRQRPAHYLLERQCHRPAHRLFSQSGAARTDSPPLARPIRPVRSLVS